MLLRIRASTWSGIHLSMLLRIRASTWSGIHPSMLLRIRYLRIVNGYHQTDDEQIDPFIFSSPGHRPCELLSWVSVRRPSVR
jgi:hypothetical protein